MRKKPRFSLISLKTKDLKKKQILSICKLKNTFWRWTVSKQIEWYERYAKKTDIKK